VHPFTASCGGAGDVRITTRVNPRDLRACLFGSLHEAGHALYEQGFGPGLQYSLLGAGISYAVHESQSRLWENMVGRSRPFWRYWYPRLKRTFPEALKAVDLNQFYRAINRVRPSLIRVEADEVTYGLHIVLRFELEQGLLEGRVKVPALPELWAAKMKEYLGVTPPNDRAGVLQDVHWSCGYFGYFPSYALGNLYAAQLFKAASASLPGLERNLGRGDASGLLEWLRERVHRHGKIITSGELLERTTGKPLDPGSYLEYLYRKFGGIYGIPDFPSSGAKAVRPARR